MRLLKDVKTNKSFKFDSWANWEPAIMALVHSNLYLDKKPSGKEICFLWPVNLKEIKERLFSFIHFTCISCWYNINQLLCLDSIGVMRQKYEFSLTGSLVYCLVVGLLTGCVARIVSPSAFEFNVEHLPNVMVCFSFPSLRGTLEERVSGTLEEGVCGTLEERVWTTRGESLEH